MLEQTASASTVALGRAFVEACNRRDADALVAIADGEIVFRPLTLGGSRRTYLGHDGLRQWVRDIADGIPFRMRLSQVRPAGSGGFVVLSKAHFGEDFVIDFTLTGETQHGRIVEVCGYLGDERMLTRLGVIAAT
jgi:hypothetical protein